MTVRIASLILVVAGVLMLAFGAQAQREAPLAHSIELDGTIDPATERWIDQALDDAADEGADLAIIRLDTPGGLDTSMREIIKDIIGAPMPVVVYVSPNGARAASAGLFITQAGDVAAMSPQTNIGSATPISLTGGEIEDVLGRKIRNDAAAYVRALAEGHGRNPDLAEEMVREATNVPAAEALDRNLIDLVADSEEELVRKLDGFRVEGPKRGVLDTEGMVIERKAMPFHLEVLQLLVNPTIAFLLITVGLIGIAIEVFGGGGLIFPGAFGVIALILGGYGTALLPFTAAGVLLLLLGVGLLIAEAHLPTGGALGAAGVAGLVAGGLLLYDTDSDAVGISAPVVIVLGVVLGGLILFVAQRVIAARRPQPLTGWEELVGEEGAVRIALDPVGQVFVEGALWQARAEAGSAPIAVGARVRVESVDGLTLSVVPVAQIADSQENEED